MTNEYLADIHVCNNEIILNLYTKYKQLLTPEEYIEFNKEFNKIYKNIKNILN